EFQRGVYDRAAFILLPICGANDGPSIWAALLVSRRAGLGAFNGLLLDSPVIHNRHGIMLAAFIGAVYARRQRVLHLRQPRRVRNLRRARKVHLEAVFAVNKFIPLLRDRRRG